MPQEMYLYIGAMVNPESDNFWEIRMISFYCTKALISSVKFGFDEDNQKKLTQDECFDLLDEIMDKDYCTLSLPHKVILKDEPFNKRSSKMSKMKDILTDITEALEQVDTYMSGLAKVKLPTEDDNEKLEHLANIRKRLQEMITDTKWLADTTYADEALEAIEDLATDINMHDASDLYDIEAILCK